MIFHDKVFKRIERIASKKPSQYILLYFMDDRIELIFSNVDEYTVQYLIHHFPLLVIYDREKYFDRIENSTYVNNLFNTILSRRVSDANKDLILHAFENISSYDIEDEDEILQRITKVLILNKILNTFSSLNINFLNKGNLTSIQKITNLPSNIYMNPSKTDESFKAYNYVAGLIKKNINKTLKDNDAFDDLKDFFYYPKLKKSNNKSEKEYLSRDINFFTTKDKIELLQMLSDKPILPKARQFYNEFFRELEYSNLYEFNYDMDYENYEYLYERLYSSITSNKITALSTNFIEEDYLEVLYEQEVNCYCTEQAMKKMYSQYGFDFESCSDSEMAAFVMEKMGINQSTMNPSSYYSELQTLDYYIDDYKQILTEESEKLIEDCMYNTMINTKEFLQEYFKSLNVGNLKHKKRQKYTF